MIRPPHQQLLAPPQLPLNLSLANLQDKDRLILLREGKTLACTVLHLQSPTLMTTFICSPPLSRCLTLGLKHAWMHLQVRNMGKEWVFEVGLAQVYTTYIRIAHFDGSLPFPLAGWSNSQCWMTLSVSLPQFCLGCAGQEYEFISYMKVYTTCRLRRIWFTDRPGVRSAGQGTYVSRCLPTIRGNFANILDVSLEANYWNLCTISPLSV